MTSDHAQPAAARLMDGRPLARRVLAEVARRVAALRAADITPTLATVLVGDDPASHAYVRTKARRCLELGIRSQCVEMPLGATTEQVVAAIRGLSEDPEAHAILVQHPVPAPVDRRVVFEAVSPEKDVDGVTATGLGRTILGLTKLTPCTPTGIMRLLAEYGVELRGADAVVVGRSPILGRPMASMLINAHSTVTLCHSHTRDLPGVVRRADVLIAAVGQPRFVQGDWIKPGAVVVDAGYNEGNVGDVDFEPAARRARLITPVPGGVGPMTIAVLMEHAVNACAAQSGLTGGVGAISC